MKEVTVSDVRRALLGLHPPAGEGAPATSELGEWFHRLYQGLTGRDERFSFVSVLDRADRDVAAWKETLARHGYLRYLAPMLVAEREKLEPHTEQVVTAWRAARGLCEYLAEIVWEALARHDGGSLAEIRDRIFAGTETDLRTTLSRPGWSDEVALVGRADALLRHPTTRTYCVLELKLGRQHPDVDLCQVALYRMLLEKAGLSTDAAVMGFGPERSESLFSAEALRDLEEKLVGLVGEVARVATGRQAGAAAPGAGGTAARSRSKPAGPMTIRLGARRHSGAPVTWSPNDTASGPPHPNLAVLGTMGTGKTQCVLSIVAQLRACAGNVGGRPPAVVIFDYKGDYVKEPFVSRVGARVWTPFRLPVNPLSLDVRVVPGRGPAEAELLPKAVTDDFVDSLRRSWGLGANQASLLRDWSLAVFGRHEIAYDVPATWSRTPPTVQELCDFAASQKPGPTGKLKAALEDLRLSQLFHPSPETTRLLDPAGGVTVLNLKGKAESLQNVVVGCVLDLLYAEMMASPHSRRVDSLRELRLFVLVDEADNFMKGEYPALRKLLKEGREFGVGVILSTQFLSHFKTTNEDYTPYLGTWVVHKVGNLTKAKAKLLGLADAEAEAFVKEVVTSGTLESVVMPAEGGAGFVAVRDVPFFELQGGPEA